MDEALGLVGRAQPRPASGQALVAASSLRAAGLNRTLSGVDTDPVPTYDEKPRWELEGKPPPHDSRFEAEAEAERLRLERARTWRDRLDQRERRRARTSVPPPRPPRAA